MQGPYRQARFLKGAARLSDLPPDRGAEVAFAGRSNAGKSSVINALTGQSALARISKTPGRTQLLNFFVLDDDRRLVDLPGYGYANVPVSVKRGWAHLVEGYLASRRSLAGVVLLMDARRPFTDTDAQLAEWCRHAGVATHVLLNKADKLGRGARGRQRRAAVLGDEEERHRRAERAPRHLVGLRHPVGASLLANAAWNSSPHSRASSLLQGGLPAGKKMPRLLVRGGRE